MALMPGTAVATRPRDASGKFVKADLSYAEQERALVQALGEAEGTIYDLEERLRGVETMMDEKGWHQLFAHDDVDGGLTLAQIRSASEMLRELVAGNPTLKRGLRARVTYVWGGGVSLAAYTAAGKPTGLTAEVRNRMRLPALKRRLFSNTAHVEFESAAFTDGNLFLLFRGETAVQRLTLDQITADLRDPDDPETIWMFRREWDRNPKAVDPRERDHRIAWYYTDAFPGQRKRAVAIGPGKTEPVDIGATMVHVALNPQIGWAYGIPDALPVVAWLRLYREFMTNGFIMSRALAQIAFKMNAKTAQGGTRLAAEVALPGQAGSAMTLGQDQDMSALATAGKGYDFGSGEPLAAMIATGLEISVSTLLAKGEATQLDLDTRAAAQMRRLDWDDAFERILAQIGSTRDLRATWADLPIEQIQRQMQAVTLAGNLGVFEGEVIQDLAAQALDIADPGTLPKGYKPGPQTAAAAPGTTGAGGATDGTGQGQSDGNPTGNNDTRDGGGTSSSTSTD